jgi:ribonuclease P protein component
MIDRKHRFHGYGSLRHVYSHGEQVRSLYLTLKYNPNPRRSIFRAAVVVSRKVDKSAVARNRIRRRLYECIRVYQNDIKEPYDLVFTVFSPQLEDSSAEELQVVVNKLLLDSGVIGQATPRDHDMIVGKEK